MPHQRIFRVKCVAYALGLALSSSVAGVARADEPTPEQVQAAAEAFDRGRDAYKAERFGEAAEQFERADSNAPSATALELAIKSRDKAGDLDRAATLALLAVERYASEIQNEETGIGKVAPGILERARKELYELEVQCNEACELVDGKKLVHGDAAAQRAIFLSPGDHNLIAGFGKGRTQAKTVTAAAGASGEVTFEAPPVSEDPDVKPVEDTKPVDEKPVDEGPKESAGWSPVVFYVGAGAAVVAAGVTIWSGLDTMNNPGKEAVQKKCAAGDENCSLYKEGQSKEVRTNVLIGVTAGLGVATGLIGALAVDWSGNKTAAAASHRPPRFQPFAGWSNGPTLGARGAF